MSKKQKKANEKAPRQVEYGLAKKWNAIAALIILGISFIIYGQSLPYEFVLDDQIVVSDNSFVKKGFQGIDDILLTESFVGYFGEQKDLIPGARYRPLSIISFAIEYGIIGKLNPMINHLVNILLYGLCGFLLFLFLNQIFPKEKKWWFAIPFLVTAIWMVHPLHTEVVANIKSRDEIMALCFQLLCILLSFRIFENKKQWMNSILLGLCFFLGLLAKENTITMLAIIPATLYFFRDWEAKKGYPILGSMVIAFTAYMALRYAAVGYFYTGEEVTDIMNNPFLGMSFMERMATVFYTLLKYLGLSYFPHPQTHDYYPFQIPRVGWTNLWVIISVLFHFGLAFFTIKNFKSKNLWAYISFFYIASLSIYSNIIINIGTTMNERFLFVPTIATCLSLVLFLRWVNKKFINHALFVPILTLLISIAFGIKSYVRTQVWENALTLNQAAVKVSTNSARSNSFMATALFEKAKVTSDRSEKQRLLDEAKPYADKSANMLPSYYNANLMKAGIAAEQYKLDRNLPSLLTTFKEVAINKPSMSYLHEYLEYLEKSIGGEEQLYRFYYEIGWQELAMKQKKYDWALKFLNYAHNSWPNRPELTFAISKVYRAAGNESQANAFLSKTLQLDPTFQNK